MNLEVRRRAYIVGLLFGTPTLPVIWAVRGPEDPLLSVTYPALTVYLLGVLVALWTRRLSVRGAERLMVVVIGGFYTLWLAFRLHTAPELAAVTQELTESVFWNINIVLIIAHVAFDKRRALQICLALYTAVVGIVASRIVPELLAGTNVSEAVTYMRILAFLGVGIVLLHILSHVKEQLVHARETVVTMTDLAHTDPLTGLANRRRLDDVLETRIADAQRYGRPLTVLLIDVDAFKHINDVFGHDTGDTVLRSAARLLLGELRATDVLGRWGGEEFLLVAPETTVAEAKQLAERCRAVLAGHGFAGVDRPVTASIGVAAYEPGDQARDLLKQVDDALYEAKRSGRNRVCVA